MRVPTPLLLGILLLGPALQPALAGGGWGQHRDAPRHEQQRPPPPPQARPQLRFEQRPPQNWGPPPQPPRSMSGNEAAQRAQNMNGGGRVLAVDPAQSGYRVRVLKDGTVRSVYVPNQ